MPRGRPRKPIELKLLDGTYRHDRDDLSTAVLADGLPEKPLGMSEGAQKWWNYLLPEVQKLAVARKVDSVMFAALCVGLWRMDRALSASEEATFGSDEHKDAERMYHLAASEVRSLAGAFGLTPSDRTRLKLEKPRTATVESRDRTA